MSEYTLSVVIPCWNCENYISQMLECIINQSFQDWKTFCVDDQSTDGTAFVIKQYASQDSRIQYVCRERMPKGAPTCRNIGYDLSEGAEFIVFFDADDLIAPYCFEQRVGFLKGNSSLDIATFPAKAFTTSIDDDTRWGFGRKCFSDSLESLLNWRTLPMVVCTNIYRRETLETNKLIWDERLLSMQDADYNIESLVLGLKQEFVNDARYDYFYRQVSSSVSKRIKSTDHIRSHIYLIGKNIDRLKSRPGYEFILKAHVVTMLELFSGHEELINDLANHSWIRRHLVFWFKLKLLAVTKLRGKKFLFKKEWNYNQERINLWRQYMSEDIARHFND